MLQPFHYAFVQRGLLEVALLSVGAGLLGTWIILRGLAFYSHAVGTATFPGLVLADGLGLAPPLGAFAAAAAFALGVERLAHRRREGHDSLTALVLVGALALGVILASDVFHSGSNVESLLFGSLLVVGRSDLWLAAAGSALALAGSAAAGRRWLAVGFDPGGARSLGVRSAVPDGLLLGLVAFAVVSSLAAIGALLATALFVVPAATVRLWTRRLPPWQLGSVALVMAEGVVGLWLSVELNVPPGPAIAMLGGAVFAVSLAGRRLLPARRLLAVAGVALLAGCGVARGDGSGRLEVVATTTQIADWARQVGGEAVSVHQILQPNTDPHEYEPRPSDVEAVAKAKVVARSGAGLDDWLKRVETEAGGGSAVVDLGAARRDPHWWQDPRSAETAVAALRDAFSRADPRHRPAYRRRAARYLDELRSLDRELALCFARVPARERKLVSDHDAFDSFARRYEITVVGAAIPSQTTQAQPSAGETARLVGLIRREHVRAVFPESSLSLRLVRTIARETGATASSTLYGDSLGPAGSPGATYVGMERANADAMARGFTGGVVGCG